MKSESTLKKHLHEDIKRIMTLEQNKENYEKFQAVLKNIKPKKCIVKSGWSSGKDIQFALIYEKYGNGNPFDEFIEGIEGKVEAYNFIMGLNPTVFHFNPITAVSDDEYSMLMFKLKR